MSWRWRAERASGEVLALGGGAFPTQGEAEAWLGESWQELLAAGADQVTLLEEDRVVYGPMSLHPTS